VKLSIKLLLAGIAAAVVAPVALMAADISGAGATFPYPIYAKWAAAYKQETGNGLNYQSIGSGGGIKQVIAGTVTFGASDKPLTPEELAKDDLIQWPMVMGGIAVVVNIDGVKSNELVLDGPTLANIFLGKIKKWDDEAIKKLNPSLKLPSADITAVHRADGSGTTFNFTHYLAKVNPEWKAVAASIDWPVGLGAKGSEGIASNVQQIKNTIGYVESAYAIQNKLVTAKMVNKDGKTVEVSGATVKAAAANADWANAKGFYLIITDQPGANAWPISASTFILIKKKPADAAAAAEALKFFAWAYAKGDKSAEELDFVPMPDSVKKLAEASWSQIVGADGKPVR
jgi:phosphate transport system substrate-binding protein